MSSPLRRAIDWRHPVRRLSIIALMAMAERRKWEAIEKFLVMARQQDLNLNVSPRGTIMVPGWGPPVTGYVNTPRSTLEKLLDYEVASEGFGADAIISRQHFTARFEYHARMCQHCRRMYLEMMEVLVDPETGERIHPGPGGKMGAAAVSTARDAELAGTIGALKRADAASDQLDREFWKTGFGREIPVGWFMTPRQTLRRYDFTSSLDAAVGEIPSRWTRDVDATAPDLGIRVTLHAPVGFAGPSTVFGDHKSEAIATCIAILEATRIGA